MQYPEGDLSVSYDILKSIYINKNYNYRHLCSYKERLVGLSCIKYQ